MNQKRQKINPKSFRPTDSNKANADDESNEGVYWIDLGLAMFTILIGICAAFLFIVDLYTALTLPLSLLGSGIATFALLISLFDRRIDPHFQTAGLVVCMVMIMTNYFASGGLEATITDLHRVMKGDEPIEFVLFPHSIEPVEEPKKEPDRFAVDSDSVELTAVRIQALMSELKIMDRIQSNKIVTAEWESEFQDRLSSSYGKEIQWVFAVRSIDVDAVYLRELEASVQINFLGQSDNNSYLQIGEHIDDELARAINANDRLVISGKVKSIDFNGRLSAILLSNVSVQKE